MPGDDRPLAALHVSPSDRVVFRYTAGQQTTTNPPPTVELKIKNPTSENYLYKVKCTK
jgi:hypothetical protein